MPSPRLHIDLETRSLIDLPHVGQYRYAEHPTTQVILASWAIDDEPFEIWRILRGDPIPPRLAQAALDPETVFVAHNAAFERTQLTVVGYRQGFLPEAVWEQFRKPARWSCTANRAAACGLPRALEKVALALGLKHQKNKAGQLLMLQMCRPIGFNGERIPIWIENDAAMRQLGAYCIDDGYAEREADAILPELSPFEAAAAIVVDRMNDRGLLVDKELLRQLTMFTREATANLNRKLIQLTNGRVPAVSNPQAIVGWLREAYDINVADTGIGKWVLAGLLEDEDIDDIVREVLVIRRDGGKSSVAKLMAIDKRLNEDNTLRGALLYCGAAATGRLSSRGAQVHNLPRGKAVKNPMSAITAIKSPLITLPVIEKMFGPAMVVASELIRPLFMAPPGYWLARGDYSQIEARVLAWLAGHKELIQAFVDFDEGRGHDLYILDAAAAYGVDPSTITPETRQHGKVIRLACGYGGSTGAMTSACKIYNVHMSDEQKKMCVDRWREGNQPIVALWRALNQAALECMRQPPGTIIRVNKVQNYYGEVIAPNAHPGLWFKRNTVNMAMRLPSDHHIVYWYARLERTMMPWGTEGDVVTYYAEDSQIRSWRRFDFSGGPIGSENATQAVARDFMVHALIELELRGMEPVLSVHDEAVCQLLQEKYPTPDEAAEAVRRVMLLTPDWGRGVPLAADASAADRYIKG